MKWENKMIDHDKIKNLLGTPPALGVEVGYTREIFKVIREKNEAHLRATIAVHCDPDAYEQTARKNAELMDELRKLYEKIKTGELVERVNITEECSRRQFCFVHPCDAQGGCRGKNRCIQTKQGVFMYRESNDDD